MVTVVLMVSRSDLLGCGIPPKTLQRKC